MKLTAQIKKAADGWLDLEVMELPDLEAHARTSRRSTGVSGWPRRCSRPRHRHQEASRTGPIERRTT